VWLARALKDHAELDRLSSGVMYHVRRIDGCSIEWSASYATGKGCRLKDTLNKVDPNRTAVAQRDGGWSIDLPWIENDGDKDCEDPLNKLVVWFRERETATQIATAFKQAINLCLR
jgi:hypothetical protein